MSAPGWYPDPSGVPGQRYFDGQQWTEFRAAAPAAPVPPPPIHKTGKSGRSILLSVGAVIFIFFFVAIVSSNDGSDKTADTTVASQARPTTPRATDAAEAPVAGLGTEVRDGKFSFVVTDVSVPGSTSGADAPRGEWMVATMTVTNIGNEPQSFFVQNQKLFDTAGREYASDAWASYSFNSTDSTMVMNLGPGLTLTDVKVPFDVPVGTHAATIVAHDSAFSGGAKVNVR